MLRLIERTGRGEKFSSITPLQYPRFESLVCLPFTAGLGLYQGTKRGFLVSIELEIRPTLKDQEVIIGETANYQLSSSEILNHNSADRNGFGSLTVVKG